MALIPGLGSNPVDAVTDGRAIGVNANWREFFGAVFSVLTALTTSGTTAARPTAFLWIGRPYFDVTLGIPIWYSGSGWVDATGAGV